MANNWFQKASVQTAIVSGIALLVVTVVVQWSPKTRLENEVSTLQRQNGRLETELAPFRALAVQRFGGPEAQALTKLAVQMQDLQGQLERTMGSIVRLDVEGVVTISGKWKSSAPPNFSKMFRTGNRGSDLRVQLKLVNSDARWIDLENSTAPNIAVGEKGAWVLDYRAQAPAGSWILGMSRDQLESSLAMEMVLYGIDHGVTEDSVVSKLVRFRYVSAHTGG